MAKETTKSTKAKKVTSKKSAEKVTTAVAVKENIPSMEEILPVVFKNVDFSGLNAAIDALGDQSKELSDEEKKSAVIVVNEWKENVIQRLYMHSQEVSDVISFFNGSYYYAKEVMSDEQLAALSKKTGTEELYAEYLAAKEACDAITATSPVSPETDDDMSNLEILKLQKQYDFEVAEYKVKYRKADRKKDLAYKAWMKAVNADTEVKDALSKARKFTNSLNKLKNECDTKTSLAKLNIQIGSKEVRKSLKSLMDFTLTI